MFDYVDLITNEGIENAIIHWWSIEEAGSVYEEYAKQMVFYWLLVLELRNA